LRISVVVLSPKINSSEGAWIFGYCGKERGKKPKHKKILSSSPPRQSPARGHGFLDISGRNARSPRIKDGIPFFS
jgi:hypothetical protein